MMAMDDILRVVHGNSVDSAAACAMRLLASVCGHEMQN